MIVNDDPIMRRVEKTAMVRRAARARAPVQEHNRHAAGIARFFPVHRMDAIEREPARIEWFERRVKFGARAGRDVHERIDANWKAAEARK